MKNIKKDADTIISVKGLTKCYSNATPLKNLNCEIKRGDVISVIGPSGTGKSTLMRCITRLETPTEGSIKVFGKEITAMRQSELAGIRQRTGMVFQSFYLFNNLTIIENVMLAPVVTGKMARQEAYERAMSLLARVGLADKALNYPDTLSGGQKQRAAIARTLAMEPEIIFFDEPTSALDPNTVGEVLLVINQLAAMGMTMMIVTHEMKFAKSIATRVFYMDKGIVYEEGTPEQIYDNPKTEQCRRFVHNLKVCNIDMNKNDINLPETVNKISEFGHKYYLSEEQITNMYRIAEELGVILISGRYGYPNVNIQTEYDADRKQCITFVRYEGEKLNVMDDAQDIGVKLISSSVKEAEYSYSDNANVIKLVF